MKTLLLWLALAASCVAQVKTVTAERGQLVGLTANLDGDVKWLVFAPLDLQYLSLFNKEGKPVLVFTAPVDAKRAVIEADCVNWDAKHRTSMRWIVNIKGDTPRPEPDNPEPNPPNPPDNVEEGYLGLTKLVASQSVPAEYRKYATDLADAFADAAEGLVPGDAQQPVRFATVKQAMDALRDANRATLSDPQAKSAWLPCLLAYDEKVKSNMPLTKYQMADALRAGAKGLRYLK